MSAWIPIIDGWVPGQGGMELRDAARLLASAHREGKKWDCRKPAEGRRWRFLTGTETAQLVGAVLEEIHRGA